MISVRVSAEEFERFRRFCVQNGIHGVSEGVRFAIDQVVEAHAASQPGSKLSARVSELESRISRLESQLASNNSRSQTAG